MNIYYHANSCVAVSVLLIVELTVLHSHCGQTATWQCESDLPFKACHD